MNPMQWLNNNDYNKKCMCNRGLVEGQKSVSVP